MIIREKEPANLEMPFSELDGPVTPTQNFYVRSHFPVPQIDLRAWKLTIDGCVAQPLELTFDELRDLESRTVEATIECAGNSRVFLTPKANGVQWELGAVGNARWTGVPLRAVLDRAAVQSSAREIVLEGADAGEPSASPRPGGRIHFARSLSVEKAREDVLLAYAMNDEPLTPAHGYPLRAIVPGWYGMASIKWLRRVTAVAQQFAGYFQTIDYSQWVTDAGSAQLGPLREMQVKAQIARPTTSEIIPAGRSYHVFGAAWSSGAEICKVELSTDAGESWQEATLIGQPQPNVWRLWELEWRTPPAPCACTLMARAHDSAGRAQPLVREANGGTYMVNHCLPIEVEVR
jgi:DMSO/TMAO reductase YedYZ molybdopterin-dependent catalytic subunit